MADTFTGLTVVVVGASGGDVVASVGQSTPAGSGLEGDAFGAVVVGQTTRRNLDASELGDAPNVVSRAQALKGLAVVAGGTSGRNVVTVVGD